VISGQLGCTLHEGDDPQACAAQTGCSMGPPLFCGGVRQPPRDPDPSQPCQCICQDDIIKCSEVP